MLHGAPSRYLHTASATDTAKSARGPDHYSRHIAYPGCYPKEQRGDGGGGVEWGSPQSAQVRLFSLLTAGGGGGWMTTLGVSNHKGHCTDRRLLMRSKLKSFLLEGGTHAARCTMMLARSTLYFRKVAGRVVVPV